MSAQLTLPLSLPERYGREAFLVSPANRSAVAFLDSWPDWPVPAAALWGPAGSGKTHLAHAWAAKTGAVVLAGGALASDALPPGAVVVEDVGDGLDEEGERSLFALFEQRHPLLLTARATPEEWPARLPDLLSRFRALLSFSLWAPDDALLEALAKKLFTDRQLIVSDAVAKEIVCALERSPAAVRDFVARADATALARKRPVTLPLVRDLLAKSA